MRTFCFHSSLKSLFHVPAARRRRQRGFNLVELMVVVGLAAIALAAGSTSLAAVIKKIDFGSQVNQFVSSMMLARSEAIKRNGRVVLCKSSDGQACAQTGAWEQGWIVFLDANNDGARDGAEPLIQRLAALSGTLRFSGNQNVANYVSFVPTGNARLVNGGFQAGTLTLCDRSTSPTLSKQIILSPGGRIRTALAPQGACS